MVEVVEVVVAVLDVVVDVVVEVVQTSSWTSSWTSLVAVAVDVVEAVEFQRVIRSGAPWVAAARVTLSEVKVPRTH